MAAVVNGLERIGVIDLGSNTARLVVYDFEPEKGYLRVDEIRELTRLGEGLVQTGALSEAAMGRALAALRLYADYAHATALANIRVLATSAVRDASNGKVFLQRLRAEGFRFDVLTGEEEARLGVLAAANSFPFEDAWVMDLGGGSAQISLMRKRRFERGNAYPLGAVRTTEGFLHDDPPTAKQVRALEAAVDEELGDVLAQMRSERLPLIAMGGTVRNLAKADRNQRGYRLPVLHGYFLGREAQGRLTARMLKRSAKKRGRIGGISPDRGDIILAGALVYSRILERAELDGIHISGYGVRDGALFQALLPAPHLVADVRRFCIDNLLWRYPQPSVHVRQVRLLGAKLFEGLQPLHEYGEWEAGLLDTAARLHDIGTVINYLDHHKHGAYLLNSTSMRGFDHREQALLTLLVRYHRRGTPKTAPFGPMLRKSDRRRLLVLATCLRLAEYLETSRAGRVADLRVHLDDPREVRIELISTEDPWAEFWETQKQASLFRRAFGRMLKLSLTPPG